MSVPAGTSDWTFTAHMDMNVASLDVDATGAGIIRDDANTLRLTSRRGDVANEDGVANIEITYNFGVRKIKTTR